LAVWGSRRALGKLLRQERFDVVICHSAWSHALFGPTARGSRLLLVSWLHNPAKGLHWLDHWARRRPPDLGVCNSRFTANMRSDMYQQVLKETVYCPVAPPESCYSNADHAAIRAELNTAEDATVIIQVSRMERLKGQALHLEALVMLRDLPGWVC